MSEACVRMPPSSSPPSSLTVPCALLSRGE
jgi:hypothetical protein